MAARLLGLKSWLCHSLAVRPWQAPSLPQCAHLYSGTHGDKYCQGCWAGFIPQGAGLGNVLRDARGCPGAVTLRTIFLAFTPHLNQLLTQSLLWGRGFGCGEMVKPKSNRNQPGRIRLPGVHKAQTGPKAAGPGLPARPGPLTFQPSCKASVGRNKNS